MARSNQKLAFALLFFTFFIWGSIYVTGKMISDDVPASLVACLRCVTAMIPLYFMSRKHLKTKIDRKARLFPDGSDDSAWHSTDGSLYGSPD